MLLSGFCAFLPTRSLDVVLFEEEQVGEDDEEGAGKEDGAEGEAFELEMCVEASHAQGKETDGPGDIEGRELEVVGARGIPRQIGLGRTGEGQRVERRERGTEKMSRTNGYDSVDFRQEEREGHQRAGHQIGLGLKSKGLAVIALKRRHRQGQRRRELSV